jgi:hypothetical protein
MSDRVGGNRLVTPYAEKPSLQKQKETLMNKLFKSLNISNTHHSEVTMKRFTILFTILGLLAFCAVIQAWADARAEAKKASVPAKVYNATGAMLDAINP